MELLAGLQQPALPGTRSPDIPPAVSDTLLLPDDQRLDVTDYAAIVERSQRRLRLVRPIADANNYQHCSPGTRVRLRTDATAVSFNVLYNRLVTGPTRNFVAAVLVDGVPHSTFTDSSDGYGLQPVSHALSFPGAALRLIELIWPYGDGMDLISIEVGPGANFSTPAPRPSSGVLVTMGDSMTHGFFASSVTASWPFKLAASVGRRLLNLANGSASADAGTANVLAGTGADRVIYMIGANDFFRGEPPTRFRATIDGWIKAAKSALPGARIYLASPLFTTRVATYPLQQYRAAIQASVVAAGGPNMFYIDGAALMTNSVTRLADMLGHPNDLGNSEIAARLAPIIS